ncbi:MAG: class I SAM-dependent methyltransferase [Gammaproteobacteria bacterium]
MDETRKKWDTIYAGRGDVVGEPTRVLSENSHLLPARGDALEIACGLAANAAFLARRGLSTLAWDISVVAIERVNRYAAEQGIPLRGEVRDIDAAPPPVASFDVIVVSHFLDRALVPALRAALRPGGLLYYQTFTRTRVHETGPSNQEFRLTENEFLRLFAGMRVLVFREEGLVGDTRAGLRDEALLVAMQPSLEGFSQ